MKRLVEKMAYGEMIRYISYCNTCPNFTKNENNIPLCNKYKSITMSNIINSSIVNNYNEKNYIIPSWCLLEEYNNSDFNNSYTKQYNNTEIKTQNNTDMKCSFCDEDDESVNRKKNFGMCSKCFEKSKTDNNIIKKAKLNNFKLKRINKVKKTSYCSNWYNDYNNYEYF